MAAVAPGELTARAERMRALSREDREAATGVGPFTVQASDGAVTQTAPVTLQVNPPGGVYPTVANVLPDDLVTVTRGGTTEQVAASALKAYLAA